MPSSADIVAGLARAANAFWPVAFAWHVLAGAALVAIALGWRPDRRRAAAALALPALSVAILAFAGGNPFNGVVLALVALTLAIAAARLPRGALVAGPRWAIVAGAFTLAYAWLYPHFLVSPWLYAIAAPIGVVPCPTLSLMIGFGLVAGGFGSRAWTLVVASAGIFYGAFGVLRLGVWLDLGLLAAAMAIAHFAFVRRPAPRSRKWVELHSM